MRHLNSVLTKSRLYVFCLFAIFCGLASAEELSQQPRLVEVKVQESNNSFQYEASYALLIGNSRYSNWRSLETVTEEIENLKKELIKQGFEVQQLTNVSTRNNLLTAIQEFIDLHGNKTNSRLLVYYAGHGHTIKGKGYLVPSEAPPVDDIETADLLSIDQFNFWSEQVDTQHVMFIFDSCFSGTILNYQRGSSGGVTVQTKNHARQVLTAGSAEETVPARSVFNPLLIKAIRGDGDFNNDGFVTGTELDTYFSPNEEKLKNTNQTPQFGYLRDHDGGDFVFVVPEDGKKEKSLANYLEFKTHQYKNLKAKVNDGRVGIVAGGLDGTYLHIAFDIMRALRDDSPGKRLRVVPMLNLGSLQALLDILHLQATDMGILQADVLRAVDELAGQGNADAEKLKSHLRYITKLYDEEVHLLANKEINSLDDLDDSKVINIGPTGSGTNFTAQHILDVEEIEPKEIRYFSSETALSELRAGNIDAMFFVVGKPAPLLKDVGKDKFDDELRLVAISGDFGDYYTNAKFEYKEDEGDYPHLLKRSGTVETIAVPAVLAAYNFDDDTRSNHLNRFCDAFVENLNEMYSNSQDGRTYHPKWREFISDDNLVSEVQGWKRYEYMRDLVKEIAEKNESNKCSTTQNAA